jgi:hypothetical protein
MSEAVVWDEIAKKGRKNSHDGSNIEEGEETRRSRKQGAGGLICQKGIAGRCFELTDCFISSFTGGRPHQKCQERV